MKDRGRFFKPETVTKAKIYARGIATGVGLTTMVVFGPGAVREGLQVGATKAEKGALSEGRKNMSQVSIVDLSHTGEKPVERNGAAFNTGGTPSNEDNAIGRTLFARDRFAQAGVPRNVLEPKIAEIQDLIIANQPGHIGAKNKILELDEALDPHGAYLQKKLKADVREAFAEAAKSAGPVVAWVGVEGAVLYKRRKKAKAQSPTNSVSTRRPSTMLELPRSTPSR